MCQSKRGQDFMAKTWTNTRIAQNIAMNLSVTLTDGRKQRIVEFLSAINGYDINLNLEACL